MDLYEREFYLELISNSSNKIYADNTASKFIQELNPPLDLSGKWEVGLVEVHYPTSWYNVTSTNNTFSYAFTFKIKMPRAKRVPKSFMDKWGNLWTTQHITQEGGIDLKTYDLYRRCECKIPVGSYQDIRRLCKDVQAVICDDLKKEAEELMEELAIELNMKKSREELFGKSAYYEMAVLFYNEADCRVIFKSPQSNVTIYTGSALMHMLGFNSVPAKLIQNWYGEPGWKWTNRWEAENPCNLTIENMNIYTDIIVPQYVGNTRAQLLRKVPLNINRYKDGVQESNGVVQSQYRKYGGNFFLFDKPHYVPLLKRKIDTIMINITTFYGEHINFDSTSVTTLKFHFRPMK